MIFKKLWEAKSYLFSRIILFFNIYSLLLSLLIKSQNHGCNFSGHPKVFSNHFLCRIQAGSALVVQAIVPAQPAASRFQGIKGKGREEKRREEKEANSSLKFLKLDFARYYSHLNNPDFQTHA